MCFYKGYNRYRLGPSSYLDLHLEVTVRVVKNEILRQKG